MDEARICRNQGCGRPGPLLVDGCCSQACSEAVAVRELIERARVRGAWIRRQLAGRSPVAALRRLQEILEAEEAAELATGCRHLTVIHGYLERHEDWELLERLLTAIRTTCAGHRWHRAGRNDRLTLTVGPPGADRIVTSLAELARELAAEAAAGGGYPWQVFLLKNPQERQW